MSDYTIVRGDEVPDYTGEHPGEFRGYGRALGAEQVAVNLRVLAPHSAHVPPGTDPDWGHSHHEQEEVYLVVAGTIRIKAGDEVATLGPRDAVRLAPTTVRSVRNDSDEDATFVLFSVAIEDARADAEAHEGFWTDAAHEG